MHLLDHPESLASTPKKFRSRFGEKEILRVAAFAGFAPFAWQENGEPRGRDLAFLRRFAASEGCEFRVDFFAFDRLWERPAFGQVEVAASGISRLARTRRAEVDWSRPYAQVRRTLLIRETDGNRFRGMEDFRGARLAAVRGSSADGHAVKTKPFSTTLTYCETLEQGIEELQAGRVDGLGTGDISARHHVAIRSGLTTVDVHGGAPPEYVAFAVRRHHPLLRRLDAFIKCAGASY